MRAILITSNWLLSLLFMGTLDMDASPLWASLAAATWFAMSTLLLNHASRRGWLTRLEAFLKKHAD